MSQPESEKQNYKPGFWGCSCMVLAGMAMMIGLPVAMLLAAGFNCAVLDVCFMADHPAGTSIVSAIVGLLVGAVLGFGILAGSHQKKQEEEQEEEEKRLDEERRRRLEEAQLRWLEEQEKKNC